MFAGRRSLGVVAIGAKRLEVTMASVGTALLWLLWADLVAETNDVAGHQSKPKCRVLSGVSIGGTCAPG